MLISVIVPVYNSRQYLASCVDSILAQTYPNIEVILVDDGATDGSAEICDAYAEKDSRVVVVHQKNQGASAARNAGVAQAKGEWIAFVDSDDALEQDFYDTLLNLAKQYSADIVHCGYKRICADGTEKEVQGTGRLLVQTPNEVVECLLTGRLFTGSPCTKLYDRNLLVDIRFDPQLKINEDYLFNIQVFRKAERIAFLDRCLYHYYERENSSCKRTDSIKSAKDQLIVAETILRMYRDTPLQSIAAGRVFRGANNLYRTYLYARNGSYESEREELERTIADVRPLCETIPFKLRLNSWLMRHIPSAYKMLYRVYDKIRKPNWDVN